MSEHDEHAGRRPGPGDTVKMSATLVLRHLAGFRAELGEDVVDRALQTLPNDLQDEVEALVENAWLAVDDIDILYGSIAAQAGRSLEELFPTVIETANEQVFNTVWKALMRLAPGRLIVRRAAALYRKSYTHGVVTPRDIDGGIALDLTHWPGITRNRILGILAGMYAALRISENNDAKISHHRTPDGVTFTVRF